MHVALPRMLLVSLFVVLPVPVVFADSKVQQLQKLTADSNDGVISLDSEEFNNYVDNPSRQYGLMLIATASHLMDKEGLKLRQLRKNFGQAATATRKLSQKPDSPLQKHPVFWVEVELNNAQEVFRRMDVQMLPLVLLIPRRHPITPGGMLDISADDKMDPGTYTDYPWSAADMLHFLSQRIGVALPLPPKPSLLTDPLLPVYLVGGIILASIAAYGLFYAPFMHFKGLYLVGALVVYWASVSGVMYDIIRGMPMYVPREDGKQLFLQGSGQLGAEGFLMGASYTGFGLAMAVVSLAGTSIRHAWAQRMLCYTALGLAFVALQSMLNVYKWKVGYNISSYLFG